MDKHIKQESSTGLGEDSCFFCLLNTSATSAAPGN